MLTVTEVTDAIETLKWLDEIPSFPVIFLLNLSLELIGKEYH
jgi:hypothetical protein